LKLRCHVLTHPPVRVGGLRHAHHIALLHGQLGLVLGLEIVRRLVQLAVLAHVLEKDLLRATYGRGAVVVDELVERVEQLRPNVVLALAAEYLKVLNSLVESVSKTKTQNYT
jgi:hypothetical protein